ALSWSCRRRRSAPTMARWSPGPEPSGWRLDRPMGLALPRGVAGRSMSRAWPSMRLERVSVVGAGAWGTALAQAAAMAGREVTLVARHLAIIAEVNARHTNSTHLGAQVLSPAIRATTRFTGADLVILAVPAQAS